MRRVIIDRARIHFLHDLKRFALVPIALLLITACSSSRVAPVQQAAMDEHRDWDNQRHLLIDATNGEVRSIDPDAIAVERYGWQYSNFDGQLLVTPNYKIHTTSPRDDFVDHLPLFFEAALAHYTTYLGKLPRPAERMETYLFQDRRQWSAKTREILPHQSNVFETLGRGGFATQGTAVLYYIDHPNSRSSRDTFSIAAHEGWHQYTQLTFRNPLPVWLEEGMATYMESFRVSPDGHPQFMPWRNYERWGALRRARHNDRLIPLSELLRRSPQSFLETGKNRLLVYYAQVWALTRFLAEGEDGKYRQGLEDVLYDAATGKLAGRLTSSEFSSRHGRRISAATGRSGPWIILEYFNSDLNEFEEEFLNYIDRITARGRQ